MEGATSTIAEFRTPPRILIPKLVSSRDGWKAKANERKKRLKAARIRIRDLVGSRASWKGKADADAHRSVELERQNEQMRQELATAHNEIERLRDELKKKERPLH